VLRGQHTTPPLLVRQPLCLAIRPPTFPFLTALLYHSLPIRSNKSLEYVRIFPAPGPFFDDSKGINWGISNSIGPTVQFPFPLSPQFFIRTPRRSTFLLAPPSRGFSFSVPLFFHHLAPPSEATCVLVVFIFLFFYVFLAPSPTVLCFISTLSTLTSPSLLFSLDSQVLFLMVLPRRSSQR